MTANLNRRFWRHYAQMVGVMFAGMIVLGLPAGWALGAAGSSWSELSAGPMLGLMAATMTVPMVPYMRRMGHGWRPTLERAASMIVPTIAVLGLLGASLVTDTGALLLIEHLAMFAGMFAVMAARPEEYAHGHRHQEPAVDSLATEGAR
jgi:hypothetical protein